MQFSTLKSSENAQPRKNAFCRIHFWTQRLNGSSYRKNSVKTDAKFDDVLPNETNPKSALRVWVSFAIEKIQNLNFSIEKQQSNIRSMLQIFYSNKFSAPQLQSHCRTILYGEKTSGLVDFNGKHCQFAIPTQRDNLYGYDTAQPVDSPS